MTNFSVLVKEAGRQEISNCVFQEMLFQAYQ